MAELKLYAPPDERERQAVMKVIEEFTAFFQAAATAREDVIRFIT